VRTLHLLIAALCTVALPVSVSAQQADDARSAGRALAGEGTAAFQADNFSQAYDRFSRAYQLTRVPMLGVWAARSLAKAGRLVEASARYLEIARLELSADASGEDLKAQSDAAEERRLLMPRIPMLRVFLEGAEASAVSVSLNGQPVAPALLSAQQPVDPGKILVQGVRGDQVVETALELREGEARDVTLSFSMPAVDAAPIQPRAALPPPSAADHTLAYASLAVGAAALVTGGVFGVLAVVKESDLEGECPNHRCQPAFHADNDSYQTKKTISTIGVVAGLGFVGVGALLYLTAPKHDSEDVARLAVWSDGAQLGLRGGF
jgi:hypothetical protein